MQENPFLVLGTGRSGTSTVARILHTQLGVCMGDNLSPPDKDNPLGGYEDLDISRPNKLFVSGKISFPYWNELVCGAIEAKSAKGIRWDIKDPTMCHLLGFFLERIKSPRLIRCNRPREKVVESIMRCYGYSEDEAARMYDCRSVALDRLLVGKGVLSFRFDREISDEEIVCQLKERFAL